ncbi:MAG TPA: SPOR domain-containing protein [Allosphingosinicella sp.]|nr:SPOR domain-containing protein [Allosphingosinicella sp.]
MTSKARTLALCCAAAAAISIGAGSAFADVRAGIEAWRAGNYEAAIREWRPLADAGDADAQFNLGQAYRLGRGVPANLPLAHEWFEKAARQGHGQAEANLGLSLFQNNQRERAVPWLTRAAERGDPRAQYYLGTAHFNGDLVALDWPRAYALMKQAADQGLPQARQSLTQMEPHLSPSDRARGTEMAAAMAARAPATASGTPIEAPVRIAQAPATPRVRTPAPAPAPAPRAEPPVVRTPVPPPVAVQRPAPAPVTRPAPAPRAAAPAPVRAAASGRWRVQLGAFSNEANARRQWSTIRSVSAVGALQHHIVRAGSVWRLQAGPLGDRAAAARVCAAARSAGHDCIPVAP